MGVDLLAQARTEVPKMFNVGILFMVEATHLEG
jgi:hypothetical protein